MGLMCTKLKSHMSKLMLLYGYPIGPGMTLPNWSRDDNRLVEILTIHMLLTPLQLVLVLQYLISQSVTVVNTLVSRHDNFLWYIYWSQQ